MDLLQSDEIRGVRQRKKNCDPTCCPVCGITVRSNEIEQHYSIELEKLHKQSITKRKALMASIQKEQPGCSSNNAVDAAAEDSSECWVTYQRIKNNRQARLKIKNKKRKADDPLCPICNERISDDIIAHVDLCLQRSEGKSNGAGSDDDSVDVESESFEEYEWAGQTRIRASSMLEGGYSAAGVGTQISYSKDNTKNEDDDEDLNVDGDDTQIFGEPQYTELDVILPLTDHSDKKDNLYLRNLIINGQSSSQDAPSTSSAEWNNVPSTLENISNESTVNNNMLQQLNESNDMMIDEEQQQCDNQQQHNWNEDNKNGVATVMDYTSEPSASGHQHKLKTSLPNHHESQKQIIESLKEKIREYELQIRNKSKCLICIDEFRIPVVSICCWHVHCEECWLRTLGARKLCPQCNMITSPSDLRRIYM